jgi:carbamoyltransferase
LAPYGRATYVEQIRKMIQDQAGGQYRMNLEYFSFLQEDKMFSQALCDLLRQPARSPESQLTQFHMDVARSAQIVLEEILLGKVKYLHDRFPSENLCMAGGVALNVVANSRCLKDGPFKRLFVQPAAGDAGSCLGAAAVAHTRLAGERPGVEQLKHVYLGPSNPVAETWHLLTCSGVPFRDFRDDDAGLIEFVVDRLLDGHVVGWVCGRMEFGPRSLGARSILADPRRPEMQDRVNSLIKQRETFRPFAPAVLESLSQEFFALDHPSPFMLETCEVISPFPLPAVTHVDGSARIQTVSERDNPRFAHLLESFYRRTGCPVLLNTSFNLRGEPIVSSVIDAISCFGRSKMELLVLDDFVLERSDIPKAWESFSTAAPRPSDDYLVYTML